MRKLFLGLLVCTSVAHAEFYSGNDLLEIMRGNEYQKLIALGYVSGVADALQNAVVCIPATVTSGQVRDMVKANLEANPTSRHYSADSLISNHLTKVWPCAKKGSAL